MDIHQEIKRITSEYFKNELDFFNLSKATKEFISILNEICGQEINVDNGRSDIYYENGKALGTFWAALCIDDLIRTRQFIRGIDKAIKDKLHKKPIHILYAGTGPFATLILPFLFRYSKEAIKYTLLEVNPFTLQILQKVISKLGLDGYDIVLEQSDATKYQIEAKNEPDIIISETMQNALAKEQQVPIFLNLMRQVKENTLFIPEKIEIHLGLKEMKIEPEKTNISHFHKVDKVFEVSHKAMFAENQFEKKQTKDYLFEKKRTHIKKEQLDGFNQLVLLTEIQIYDNEYIRINESGLTTPIILENFSNDLNSSLVIDTQYILSSEPKLDYKITHQS